MVAGGGGGSLVSYAGHGGNAGGGSSFISGYLGCNAISESYTASNITHTGQSIHSSGYQFTDMEIIDGGSTMTSPIGTTETGHSGNGYARITFLGTSIS